MYHGNELVNKIGDAFTYMEASGDTPTPPTPVPYAEQYLTFVAGADNMSVGLTYANRNVFQYSVDSGTTWSNLADSGSTTSVNSGQTIMFKASGLTVTLGDGIGTLTPSVSASVQGNVMSLFYGDDFSGQTTITKNDQFRGLFYHCANLTSAENLILPATSLKQYCYGGMFAGCTSLTSTPVLPATALDNYCYRTMFDGCTSLTVTPELPSTTLAQGCYYMMFRGCTSLTTTPELPATTLAENCYQYMFSGCTSLTAAPVLSATTLASNCYYDMFQNCTSLTTAPELPATTLANYCYQSMFENCTSLTTAPELSATTLADYCYQAMFRGCTNLNSITCLATDISATYCTRNWVSNVATSGTFVKAASMSNWTTGTSGIPSGWIVEDKWGVDDGWDDPIGPGDDDPIWGDDQE